MYTILSGHRYFKKVILFFVFIMGSFILKAQNTPVKESQISADLTRYFKSAAQEQQSRVKLLDSVREFKSDSTWSLVNLRAKLDAYQHFLVELNRHNLYRQLSAYRDNTDTLARADLRQIGRAKSLLIAFCEKRLDQPVIYNLSAQELKKFELNRYRFLIGNIKDAALHNLSEHDQALVDQLSDPVQERLTDRYDHLIDEIQADPVFKMKANLDTLGKTMLDKQQMMAASRAVRNKAFLQAYTAHEEVFGAILIDIAAQQNALAMVHGYSSAPSRIYKRRLQLDEPEVKALLAELTKHAGVLQQYQKTIAALVQQKTGLDKLHSWDLSVSLGFLPPRRDFSSARNSYLKALRPLGKEYVDHFAQLTNPENGSLDINGGPNRVTEFTALRYPGVPTTVYMKEFDGNQRSVSVLIHEAGHAVHGQLMSTNLIVPRYASGPNFLSEAYAIFNELLLLDELQRQSKTKDEQAYYVKQFTDMLAFELFTSAEEGAFEQALYEGIAAGKILNAKDIDRIYSVVMNSYDLFFKDEPERHGEWIKKRLLFDDPIYNVTYLYSMLVACKLYKEVQRDPVNFGAHYTALLKNGFDAPADELLLKFMGFGLNRKDLIDGALQLMDDKTKELTNLSH